jgi:peptidoglycan/xylan/chitin deacetylase (PgdA/CDA1 family)
MITELALLGLLYIPWCIGITGYKTNLLILFIFYRIPKIIIKIFEYYYPNILFRNKKSNRIALTFDDVPYDKNTNMELIINKLNKYDMKGTFFIISDYVNEDNINVLIKAVKDGHQLGNHGKTNSMHALKTFPELQIEIQTCDRLIKSIYNIANVELPKTMVYRPGCGLFHSTMIDIVREKGYVLTLGSVYPHDPIVPFSFINYYNLISTIEQGDIVILHDRLWTNEYLLDNLLQWMIKHNYRSDNVTNIV